MSGVEGVGCVDVCQVWMSGVEGVGGGCIWGVDEWC